MIYLLFLLFNKFDSILYKSAGDANIVKERFKHIQEIIQSILL